MDRWRWHCDECPAYGRITAPADVARDIIEFSGRHHMDLASHVVRVWPEGERDKAKVLDIR